MVVAQLDVEAAVAAEVGVQVEAGAQVVRAPGLVLQVEHQRLAVRAFDEAVVGARVVAAGGQPARVGLGLLRCRTARRPATAAWPRSGRGWSSASRRTARPASGVGSIAGLRVLRDPLRVLGRGRRVGRERRGLRLRVVVADLDELRDAAEVARAQLAELGAQQQVARRERRQAALDVLVGQDRDHLLGEPDHRLQRLAPGQRRADVDDDHDVDAHRARDVHRHVVDQPAVAQQSAVDLGGREHARHAHARSQRHREVAVREDHGLAGLHVGGHGAERDGEVVEVVDVAHRQRQPAQQQLQAAARQRALRRAQLAVVHAELEAGGDLEVLFLAPLREEAAAPRGWRTARPS